MKICLLIFLLLALITVAEPVNAQPHQPPPQGAASEKTANRNAAREKLRTVLTSTGPKVNIDFRQSDKNPYNFVGLLKTGLSNTEFFEVVVGVSEDDTIGFRIYPHYRGGYINLDRASNGGALARQLLRYSDTNFLFWGADKTGDVFAGYTFTLESGFPDQAIDVVLHSIKPLDQFVGELKPMIDG